MLASDAPDTPRPRGRRFTLADAMILVAATAPGLALLRLAWNNNFYSLSSMALAMGERLPPGYVTLDHFTSSAWCLLPSLTLAALILTALRPGPTRGDAIGGPGFVACLAASLAPLPPLARLLGETMGPKGFGVGDLPSNEFLYQYLFPSLRGDVLSSVGTAIVAGWLALVLAGRWRPRAIWTDRFGCLVGASWVLVYGINQFCLIVAFPLLKR